MLTYRYVVEVRQQPNRADDRDDRQQDTAHRRLSTRAGVDLTSTVASKSWDGHEDTTDHVSKTKSNQLSVRRDCHPTNAIGLLNLFHRTILVLLLNLFNLDVACTQTLCSDTALEKA